MSELIEMHTALRELEEEIGPRAEANLNISRGKLMAWVYPQGIGGKETIYVHGKTDWREAVEEMRTKARVGAENRYAQLVKDMALAIVRITFETGGCSDAQLRADFDAADVAHFGETACDRANEMADKGPFVLTLVSGANDAVGKIGSAAK